ncbi:hypothetical protein DEO72_LG8g2027 [Vigna unguiculata]|uniref:Uncharacterized protein n=1 Tax=Vigna unguiculata TaxID=3917 RepID=A0A4D6MVS2_VIGUN|nr:hypothetical protein DEO72_LG8g2027 [Vigna unguiculata]
MSHNSHTHTGNTRQLEPQLKSSSCSSAIPSHNSRDAILNHNSRNVTCLTPIPSHNSKDTFRATTQGTFQQADLSGKTCFQTAWRGTRAARREAPHSTLTLQTSPGGTTLTASKLTFQVSPKHCRSLTSKVNNASTIVLSPGAAPELLGKTCFQTAWRGTRAARREAPHSTLTLQTSPGGTTLTARCHTS